MSFKDVRGAGKVRVRAECSKDKYEMRIPRAKNTMTKNLKEGKIQKLGWGTEKSHGKLLEENRYIYTEHLGICFTSK